MRGFVFIDGNNLYFKLKRLAADLERAPRLGAFDFMGFSRWLVAPHDHVGVRYYIGAVKQGSDEKSRRLYADQQRLFRRLQRQGVELVLGHLIRHPDRSFHEKGVDVRLAVEMIRLAREHRYDQAYLVSSDTDLVPAVEEVQRLGRTVQYVGTPKGQSYGLSKVADDVRLLRPEDVAPFFESRALVALLTSVAAVFALLRSNEPCGEALAALEGQLIAEARSVPHASEVAGIAEGLRRRAERGEAGGSLDELQGAFRQLLLTLRERREVSEEALREIGGPDLGA